MFEKFSPEAIKVIMLAQEEARRLKHRNVGCEHLLLGLLAVGPDVVSFRILSSLDLNVIRVREEVEKIHSKGSKASPREMPFDADAKLALIGAHAEAMYARHPFIYSEHLLLGLLHLPIEPENVAFRVLSSLAVEREKMRREVMYMAQSARPGLSDTSQLSQEDE